MGIFETFSKRLMRQKKGGQVDVLQYEDLSSAFRVQVIHIWVSAIGPYHERGFRDSPPNKWWVDIHGIITRELGVFNLTTHAANPFEECQLYLQTAKALPALDLIELTFLAIHKTVRTHLSKFPRHLTEFITQGPDSAIDELNKRFAEHAIGYEFIDGELIRKDSQFVHAEVVRPAIQLLSDAKFRGPSEEFLRAHEHYRHGRHKEAMVEALKSFESTMKAICDARRWAFKPTDTAKPLIEVLLKNELVPAFLATHLPALATVLESGLPTVRNKLAGHGQGATPVDVPSHFVAYALHLAAANIVMLMEAHKAKK